MTSQIDNALTAARRELASIRATEQQLRSTGHYTDDGLREALRQPRLNAIKKLEQLNATYIQPHLNAQVEPAEPKLPEVAEHEATALLQLWQTADSGERARMRAEALSDAKLAAVLISSHPRLTHLGDEARQTIFNAHCEERALTTWSTAQDKRHQAETAHAELKNIAQAVAGGEL